MRAVPLGKIIVATAGTPVQVSADATLLAAKILVQAVIGETGRMFLGTAGLDRTTHAGVIRQFHPTGAGGAVPDSLHIDAPDGTNALRLADYWVDANVNGEGLLVTYWVR